MKSITLFFFHPNKFFKQFHDGKLRAFVFKLFIAYVIASIIWRLQIDSSLHKTLLPFSIDNEAVRIFLLFVLDAGLLLCYSVILRIIAKVVNIEAQLTVVILSVFSIEVVDVLSMLMQLIMFNYLGEIKLLNLIDTIAIFYCIVYLYFPIKYIFKFRFFKTFLIQIISLIGFLTIFGGYAFLFAAPDELPETNELVKHLKRNEINDSVNESTYLMAKHSSNAKLRFDIGEAFTMYLLQNPEIAVSDNIAKKRDKELIISQAEKAYQSALQQDPTNLKARNALGNLYYLMGKSDNAIEQFTIAIEGGLTDSQIYRKMAAAHLKLKNLRIAKQYYDLIPETDRHIFPKGNLFELPVKEIVVFRQDLSIVAEGVLDWRIADEMLYDLSVGSRELAELYLKTGFSSSVSTVLFSEYGSSSSLQDLKKTSKDIIIARINKFLMENNYGIKIVNLECSFKKMGSNLE